MLQPSFAAERPTPSPAAATSGASPLALVPRAPASGRTRRRLRRLLRMSPTEIAYRAAERLRIEADRRRVRRRDAGATRRLDLDLAGGAGRVLFDPSPGHRCAVTAWLASQRADVLATLHGEAEEILSHRVRLFSFGAVDLGPEIDWHLDPVANARWEIRFFADYDLVDGGGPDPKVVHELARHGHLTRLAAAYYTIGDERYARECLAQMLSWIEQNPAGWGVHWCSSLEAALRVLNWMTTLVLLAPSSALPKDVSDRIGASVAEQLAHIRRYLSIYSSPNTHLLGEAAALYVGGLFLGGGDAAAGDWKREGARLLEGELDRQVGADGVYGEPSTYYHAYALDLYLLVMAAARRVDPSLAGRLRPKVERMAEFLAAVARADGSLPGVGDDDGGTAFPLAGPNYGDVRDLLSAAALACDRPDLFRSQAPQRALWLFGPDALDSMAESARGGAAVAVPSDFTEAGLFRQTMAAGHTTTRLLFDAGGMGIGGGGHAHADALQVTWDIGDRPVLVDSGTGIYNRAPEWRDYFRSTRAHNTVTVDDRPQSVPAGTFGWERMARTTACEPVRRAWCQYAGGTHDGYMRLRAPLRHRRHVLALGGGTWVIADVLEGTGRHRGLWTWHFAPDLEVTVSEAESLVRAHGTHAAGDTTLAMATSSPSHARLVSGQLAPIQGWVSTRYGERKPAPVLEVAVQGDLPLVAVTLLRADGRLPRVEVERRAGGLHLSLEDATAKDDILLGVADIEDELMWCRHREGVVTHLLAAGAGGVRRLESQED